MDIFMWIRVFIDVVDVEGFLVVVCKLGCFKVLFFKYVCELEDEFGVFFFNCIIR